MFNNKFTKKDPIVDVISQIISERWDDDDEDDDVKRADAELRRMKAKPIEADKGTDPDKEVSKLAKKTPKEVEESVEKKSDKDYDKDGKIESGKDEFWGSRLRAAKMKNEDKWTDIADGPWKKSKKSSSQAMSSAHNLAGKGMKDAKSLGRKPDLKAAASYLKSKIKEESDLQEKTLTPAESKKKEEIVKSMKKDKKGLKARYGKRWKEVAYATATKSAKRVAEDIEQIDELSKDTLTSYVGKASKSADKSYALAGSAASRGKSRDTKQFMKHAEKFGKRKSGIDLAKKKISNEDVNLHEEYADMSHAAKELVLHADNHAHLYHSSHTPIMNNLKKKMKNGTYDSGKAKKLWAYHADRAAQSYAKEHGDGRPWHKMFSTSDRKQAASHWEDMHKHELHESFNEAKGPTSDYGLETFATNEVSTTPLERAKSLARAALSKVKNEMLGKAGATSEEIDPRVKTTDTLKGRIKGGKDDDVGPGATGRSTKVKFTPGPK